MKKIIIGLMATAIVATVTFYVFSVLNKDEEKYLDLPNIVCWGDSLTVGVGSTGTNYPDNLYERLTGYLKKYVEEAGITGDNKKILLSEIKKLQIINEGWSGETTLAIGARAGGIELLTTSDMQFASWEKEKEILFCAYDQRVAEPWHGDDAISVMVGETEGILRFNSDDFRYYFTRKDAGSELLIPAGTTISPLGLERYDDDITIIFMGQNGGYLDAQDLINQQKSMIPEEIYEKGHYLILGITSGTREERQELEGAMEAEYGDNYINLREYMSGESVADFVTELSAEDREQMAIGQVPACLLAEGDTIHFNEHGYEMIGYAVFVRMLELGFFEEIEAKINAFAQ